MVNPDGIGPSASSMSMKRSTSELRVQLEDFSTTERLRKLRMLKLLKLDEEFYPFELATARSSDMAKLVPCFLNIAQ